MSKTLTDSTPTVTDPILEVRDLTVYFEMDRGRSVVTDGVDIDIERHEILGIAGESGSGKSMFASALLDAVIEGGTTQGEIRYNPSDGDPVDILNLSDSELKRLRWEEISMVFQGAMSSFNPTLSIEGHFLETLDAHGVDRESGMERAHQLLSDLYLKPDRVLESYPHELSGGMKQRTLVALALVLEPEVLVLDEPTAALDLLMQRSIISLLREISEQYDLTMVFITHDLPLLTKLADRLAIMYAFEFVELGPTRELLTDAAHPYTRMLLTSTPNVEAPIDEMRAIEGSSPDPVNTPEGCSFHVRCPLATEQCRQEDPRLEPITDDKSVACYHFEDADEAIPTTWMDDS